MGEEVSKDDMMIGGGGLEWPNKEWHHLCTAPYQSIFSEGCKVNILTQDSFEIINEYSNYSVQQVAVTEYPLLAIVTALNCNILQNCWTMICPNMLL